VPFHNDLCGLEFFYSGFNSMANERKTAQLTMFYAGTVVVVDGFPADKFDELKSFAENLTQPAIVPNMSPQSSASSSTQITRGNCS
jgi:hypothetical protein